MPLYEYRCTQCGNRYEKIQSFSTEPDTVCPKCGGKVERPLTAPALQFKGAGWYINDYAPKPASGSGSTEKPAGDSSSGSSDAKTTTESKPAATESKPASTESSAKASTPSSSSAT